MSPATQWTAANRTVGWMGIRRGHRANPVEWVAEKCIFLVSLSCILTILLIFAFVGGEALPVILGQVDSSASGREVISPEAIKNLSPEQLRAYLELTPAEFERLDAEALAILAELRAETAEEAPDDKDAAVNTASWRYLVFPYQWSDYNRPVHVWQPISAIPKYNIIPLIIGSVKTTLVALLFSFPLALGAAIFVSQLAPPRLREYIKPAIELLAGVPSVVLGFFALIILASFLQNVFGYPSRLNAFVAGIALGLAIIPVVFSIAEDALTSVPRSYTEGALALGSSRWQAAWQIVMPAALPGVFAAGVLGFGRAFGETMIVLMASGNASLVTWDIFDSTRTITATIAAEVLEAVRDGHHYRMLFLIGVLLFLVTFLSNLAGELVIQRLKNRLESKA